jgi:hypothetical protein
VAVVVQAVTELLLQLATAVMVAQEQALSLVAHTAVAVVVAPKALVLI